MTESALEKLASLLGLVVEKAHEEPGDNTGNDVLLSLLAGLGIQVSTPSEAEAFLQQEQLREWQSMLDPVHIRREGAKPLTLPARIPASASVRYEWSLTEENGSRHTGNFKPAELAVEATFENEGQSYSSRLIRLDIDLPCGYHQFSLHEEGDQADSHGRGTALIITPGQCYIPPGLSENTRIWGLGLHLHALRSKHNWGTGDFSDLETILNWAAEHGAGTLHPAPLNELTGFGKNLHNPYSPSCRSLLNMLFIDVEKIAELPACEEAVNRLQDIRFQARLSLLRESDKVDYPAVYQAKNELLTLLWKHFSANHLNPETDRGREFRTFQEQEGDRLRYYGIFMLLQEKFSSENNSSEWFQWPEQFRDPRSRAVADFTEGRQEEVEYYQYVQWLADLQLAGIGRRSMERGLKLGLVGEFPFGPHPSGFETWYYHDFFRKETFVTAIPHDEPAGNPGIGLPLFLARDLMNFRFQPLIDGLRHAMRNTGAVFIRGLPNYFKTYFTSGKAAAGTAALLPFHDILGIIALESRRNKCLVIADNIHLLPQEEQLLIREKNIFSNLIFFKEKNEQGDWLPAKEYPENGVINSSSAFLATLKGFWTGKDIVVNAEMKIFRNEKEKEKAIIARTTDRAHLLIALKHAQLLPEGYQLDPAAVPALDHDLITSLQIYLAKSPAKILLVSLNDLLELENPAEPPGFPVQNFWTMRYPEELEKILTNQHHLSLFKVFCKERGIGVTRPSVTAMDRKKGEGIVRPSSFYRLQLNRDFTFLKAIKIIPYLKELGISHCYVSPFLKARPGSSHGYDIIDHTRINPEIGTRREYEHFIAAIEQNRMAMILDVVPNHMGVGSDNKWWMDVLENGEASEYAGFFDINWQPQQEDLVGRVLLPVLGDHYGKVLETGQLQLHFDADSGSFTIHYYEQRFPVDPKTYAVILNHNHTRLEDKLGKQHNGYLEYQNLIRSFDNLPERLHSPEEKLQNRRRHIEINKRILARLCRECPEIRLFIEENLILFNGEQDKPESYDPLHNLLEQQAYRLAFWRVAADEINYRRFFDVNDLAGLRMEKLNVFQETHRLILDLIATGKLDGLRIDHPDGLYDPAGYFRRLQAAASGESLDLFPSASASESSNKAPFYLVVEKILADFEHLPLDWQVHGTTGYDFSNILNGLFVDSSAEKIMTGIYHRFIGRRMDFEELVLRCKKLIIRSLMSGELNTLTTSLYRLAQGSRHTRDFRLNRLRDALTEIVACFPVYRTYTSPEGIHKNDVQFTEWAVEKAKQQKQLDDASVFDFIKNILLGNIEKEKDREPVLDFCMKFQQYTGPVMAKGLEDTSFYIYNRLLSLNEVGGEPKRFGTSVAAFHHTNQYRMRYWPHAMLNTSTHDSKRSEDARARINVISEMPDKWQKHAARWSRLNRSLKTQLDVMHAPDRNDEYSFYQNLLGIWPPESTAGEKRGELVERMRNYMLKACRESKEHTSWITPSEPYENAVIHFVKEALKEPDTAFIQDFLSFHKDISWFGMLNSLSQVLLKLVSPGIPDIYQGNEFWQFCLVDPDNRRPIDFDRRRAMLHTVLDKAGNDPENRLRFLGELLDSLPDGRAKLFVIAVTLQVRNEWKMVFDAGSYLPLETINGMYDHICAFARKFEDRVIIAVAPRLYCRLMQGRPDPPLGETVWQQTAVKVPEYMAGMQLRNVYSNETVTLSGSGEGNVLKVADLLRAWPIALLQGTIE
ncbi:MAG: malto-oligosyltrehalose synthase [Desulfobulbaceae bacterium]|nr:malto-oligosyltrehalose synthase [Desulfobulbaceae bacterium]